jgi:hypothetical protein
MADGNVAEAMYKTSVGYYYEEEHVCNTANGPVVVKVKRYKAGDSWAQAKWLAVRQRAMWSEAQRLEITSTHINKLDFSALSTEELLAIKNIQAKQLSQDATGS